MAGYEDHEAAPLEIAMEGHRKALFDLAEAHDARTDALLVNARLLGSLPIGWDVRGHAKALKEQVHLLERDHGHFTAAVSRQMDLMNKAQETLQALRAEEDAGRRAELAREAKKQVELVNRGMKQF